MPTTTTGVWSNPPTARVTTLRELGDLSDKISAGAGESTFVCKLRGKPGWLYKEYRAPSSDESVSRLDRLIGLPAQMPAQDKSVVDGHTAWPAARVVNGSNRTTGVLLPMAPEAYKFEMALPAGRSVHKYLEVDVLALSAVQQRQVGLPPQSLADRIAVCASIAAAADLLERHGLVYLDWSYANIFWRPADHSAYLIDLDGSSFGPRPQIQAPQWDDPHVPLGTTAGNTSDRYRLALLITTCLTGKRVHDVQARTELGELRQESAEVEQLAELLIMALTAAPSSRPTIARIKAALDAADSLSPGALSSSVSNGGATGITDRGGVKNWKPIGQRSAATGSNPQVTYPWGTSQSRPTPAQKTQQPSAPPVPPTTSSPSQPPRSTVNASSGGSGRADGTGGRAPSNYRSRPPASPSSSAATVVKATLTILAIIIICIIIANL